VRLESLQAESLELRQLMAVLPAPLKPSELQRLYDPNLDDYPFAGIENIYSPTATISGGVVTGQNGFRERGEPSTNVSSPILSVNPLNPNHQVVVAQLNNFPLFGSTIASAVRVSGYVTQNGGQTWSPLALPNAQGDPTVAPPTAPPDMRVQDISAAIDRNGDIYVVQSQLNSAGNAGLLQLRKFNATGGILSTQTLYSWDRSKTTPVDDTYQQARLKPFVVVNTNPSTFTDPVTGQTQNDPGSGNVYISYVTETPLATPPSPYNPFTVRMIASSDGGSTFGAEVNASTGFVGSPRGGSSMPLVRPAVGPGGGTTPGKITLVWDSYDSQSGTRPTQILARTYSVAGNVLSATGAASNIFSSALAGANAAGQYPTLTSVTGEGIGSAPVVAVDSTLGSLSRHKGRIYVAWTDYGVDIDGNPSDNTDIFFKYSDNNGVTWSARPSIVNDDAGNADGYSGAQYQENPFSSFERNGVGVVPRGGRPQFMPSIAVDQTTGTVAVSYLDSRYDASRLRVVNSVSTSIDGGSTFSASNNANLEANPTNIINGETVFDIPIPDNQSTGNPVRDAAWGFGQRSSVQAFAGQIFPAWSFNVNAGYSTDNFGGANVALIRGNIAIGRMYVAAGPRVISSTMGDVRSWTAGGNTFNNTFDGNGVQQVDGFTFTFDRQVQIGSVDPSSINLTYTDVFGNQKTIPVTTITALNPQNTNGTANPAGLLATQFFASFPAQNGVGTYSYEIGSTNIRDGIRTVDASGAIKIGNLLDQDNIPLRQVMPRLRL
jgi:hypothetical protein